MFESVLKRSRRLWCASWEAQEGQLETKTRVETDPWRHKSDGFASYIVQKSIWEAFANNMLPKRRGVTSSRYLEEFWDACEGSWSRPGGLRKSFSTPSERFKTCYAWSDGPPRVRSWFPSKRVVHFWRMSIAKPPFWRVKMLWVHCIFVNVLSKAIFLD